MTLAAPIEQPADPAATKAGERRALAVAGGAHALHDGYTELIYVVLPIWQAEFGLGYAALGLLRTVFSGTMASFQIPASLIAERIGGGAVLAAGTALAGLCYCLAALSADFTWLLAALLLGGLGASTQHPIGSALVARAFAGVRSLTALGTYNFSGDVGKMLVPAAATGLLLLMPWRPAVTLLGMMGLAAAVAIFLLTPRFIPERDTEPLTLRDDAGSPPPNGWLNRDFCLLLTIGALDSATRAGFMVYLPFMIIGKGGSIATAGLALTVFFVGGAAGKLVCAQLGARFGVVNTIYLTQVLTTAGMLAVLFLPLWPALILLPLVGIVLNGTSSVVYGSVPRLVTSAARTRAFSIFYTGTLGAGALAPTISGLAGDAIGMTTTIVIVATLVLVTVPIAWLLRAAFTR